MPQRPHVAYIAWGFPPSRSGGTYRQLATANALAAEGWSVTVVTVDRRAFTEITGADLSLEERVDPRVKVLRTRFDWPLRNSDRSTWPLARRIRPGLWRKARVAYEKAVFPEVGYSEWLRTLRAALTDLHRRRPLDLVLATGNPHVAFAAAHRLHRATGVPYVIDYRDAWLLDVFSGRQLYPDRSRPARWERRLMGAAAQAWFINQDILDWHADRYPHAADRFRLVPNGWDPELARCGPGAATQAGAAAVDDAVAAPAGDAGALAVGDVGAGAVAVGDGATRPLTFGYLGTMSGNAPMPEVVAGWRTAKAKGLIPSDAVLKLGGYLGYFGAKPDPARDPVAAAILGAAADGVDFVGRVDKTAVGCFYDSLDALVLPIRAGRYVTSGKVYEYAATGKPIISLHASETGSSRVLAGYPLWALSGALDADAIAAAFGRGADLARSLTPSQRAAALAFGQRFTRQRQLGPAVAGLKDLLG
ncbi:MAG: glycosyltransferase [Bifidobacteriaceae bacterium]|jgi:glycosyltransferase involved in cell wall biosynthesis|nr:glycosyltransferase [Bifidobacteriaceae bacterium]